jgi:hypothetical protein
MKDLKDKALERINDDPSAVISECYEKQSRDTLLNVPNEENLKQITYYHRTKSQFQPKQPNSANFDIPENYLFFELSII